MCGEESAAFSSHKVGPAELALIQEVVGTCGGLSRMELAATVCELLGWKRRTGSLKARECREFLEKLQSQGGLVLPAKRPGRPAGKATEVPVTARGEPGARLVGTARDLGEIRLQRVQRLEQRRLFRELVGRYHYLGVSDHRKTYFFGFRRPATGHANLVSGVVGGNGSVQRLRPQIEHRQRVGAEAPAS